MGLPNQQQVESYRKQYPAGTRIELESMHGEEHMPAGSTGTVEFVDDAGQLHMAWDKGGSLALIQDVDRFRVISIPEDSHRAEPHATVQHTVNTGGRIKPDCPLIGANGNIYNLAAIATITLKANGKEQEACEMWQRIKESHIYDAALMVIEEYVNFVEAAEPGFDLLDTDQDKALWLGM